VVIMKILDNGYLEADRSIAPPMAPDGFEVAFGDPYVFLPVLPPCRDRTKKIVVSECCGATEKILCQNKQDHVTRGECAGCKGG